jgi:hypothetical protein
MIAFITIIAGRMGSSRFASAWLKLILLSAASEIPMTMLSPKPSTGSTRPR